MLLFARGEPTPCRYAKEGSNSRSNDAEGNAVARQGYSPNAAALVRRNGDGSSYSHGFSVLLYLIHNNVPVPRQPSIAVP